MPRPRSAALISCQFSLISPSRRPRYANPPPVHGQSRPRGHIEPMKPDTDILIIGGGLNGPALALALAQGGFRVTLVDARPAGARGEAGFDGRAYALALASVRALTALKVWPQLAARAQPILGIRASQG